MNKHPYSYIREHLITMNEWFVDRIIFKMYTESISPLRKEEVQTASQQKKKKDATYGFKDFSIF